MAFTCFECKMPYRFCKCYCLSFYVEFTIFILVAGRMHCVKLSTRWLPPTESNSVQHCFSNLIFRILLDCTKIYQPLVILTLPPLLLQVAGLILENTFTSILDMAGVLLPFLKWFIGKSSSKGPKVLNFLVRSPWSTIDVVGEVSLHVNAISYMHFSLFGACLQNCAIHHLCMAQSSQAQFANVQNELNTNSNTTTFEPKFMG